jgi:hypothetical protein
VKRILPSFWAGPIAGIKNRLSAAVQNHEHLIGQQNEAIIEGLIREADFSVLRGRVIERAGVGF